MCGNVRYNTHLYCLAVQAGFYSYVVECWLQMLEGPGLNFVAGVGGGSISQLALVHKNEQIISVHIFTRQVQHMEIQP